MNGRYIPFLFPSWRPLSLFSNTPRMLPIVSTKFQPCITVTTVSVVQGAWKEQRLDFFKQGWINI